MRITIHEEKCCGAGQCVIQAPELFDQRDEDGVVILLNEQPPQALHAKARMAAKLCPAIAIELAE